MAKKIGLDSLESEIMKILNDYTDEICEEIKDKAEELAEKAKKELIATSPRSKGGGTMGKNDDRPYHYADKWKVDKVEGTKYFSFTIKQGSPKYRLTHLLEYGHLTADGTRAKAIPHIAPVQEKLNREFEQAVEDIIKNT